MLCRQFLSSLCFHLCHSCISTNSAYFFYVCTFVDGYYGRVGSHFPFCPLRFTKVLWPLQQCVRLLVLPFLCLSVIFSFFGFEMDISCDVDGLPPSVGETDYVQLPSLVPSGTVFLIFLHIYWLVSISYGPCYISLSLSLL